MKLLKAVHTGDDCRAAGGPAAGSNAANAALNAPPPQAAGPSLPFVPGEVLVTLAPGVLRGSGEMGVSALAGQMGGRVAAFSGSLALFSFDEQADVQALSAQLASQGNVIAAQPNYVFSIPENNTTREASTTAERDLLAAGTRSVAFTGREGAQAAKRTLTRAQLRDLRTTTRRGGAFGDHLHLPSRIYQRHHQHLGLGPGAGGYCLAGQQSQPGGVPAGHRRGRETQRPVRANYQRL